jgi:hypothetical protein
MIVRRFLVRFLKFYFVAAISFGCMENVGQTDKNADLKPTPVLVLEDDLGDKQVIGWTPTANESYTYHWHKEDGSAIWHQEVNAGDFNLALKELARLNGFNAFQVKASQRLEKDIMFDEKGEARTIIAEAKKAGKDYRLALLLFYGRLFEGARSMGVHAYAAPTSSFVSSGGWVVPSTFWFGIDPKKDVGNLVKQGSKPAKEQAEVFAKLGDIWIESMYNLYVNQMQMNVQALHNLRISAIAAGDPNAVVVPGSNGYNEIDYQY